MPTNGRGRTDTAADAAAIISRALSGLAGRDAPEQAGRLEHQHQHQDREDDDVGPGGGDELSAHRLDQPNEHAAHHGSWHIADATEHSGSEGTEPRSKADDKT